MNPPIRTTPALEVVLKAQTWNQEQFDRLSVALRAPLSDQQPDTMDRAWQQLRLDCKQHPGAYAALKSADGYHAFKVSLNRNDAAARQIRKLYKTHATHKSPNEPTPIVDLSALLSQEQRATGIRLLAKCEYLHPSLSIKDRMARHIMDKAEKAGRLKPGMTVVAASSGNTGAAVAMLARQRGYSCIITTSPQCSEEKRNLIRSYGAKLIISQSNAKEGTPGHYMSLATSLALGDPKKYFDIDQYENRDNTEAYEKTLGPEILRQTQGRVSHFVAGGSTGGTASGTARFLKGQNPQIVTVLAEPRGSVFAGYFQTGSLPASTTKSVLEGVGKASIPGTMDFGAIDRVVQVADADAIRMCHRLTEHDFLLGGSSGLNVSAALQIAAELREPALVVTVLPDHGLKYLSKIYNARWLAAQGFPAVL